MAAICHIEPSGASIWDNFCNAVGRPEWIPRRYEPMPQTALIAEVAGLFASRSQAEWDAILVPADCCYQAVLDLSRRFLSIRRFRPRYDRAARTIHGRAVPGVGRRC